MPRVGFHLQQAEGTGPISSSAGQHLVDADHVEGMQAHADVEAVFAAGLHHVLVSADAGSLQSCSGGRGAEAESSQHSLTAETPKTVTSAYHTVNVGLYCISDRW